MTHSFIQSVQWKENHLLLLDQNRLPEETRYHKIDTIEEVWKAIRQLTVRGAPAIGITAAYGLYLGVQHLSYGNVQELIEDLKAKAEFLSQARPTAINLRWALMRLLTRAETDGAHGCSTEEVKAGLLAEALRIQKEDEETCRRIGEYGLTLLKDGMGILTHCNPGSLATAKYGTATAPFYLAREQGMTLKIFIDETRPVLQGARLTAWELMQAGIDSTLICDNMAALVMAKGWVQAVIVGADRVAANGDVANKIGTYGLAVLAKAHNIPFYVAAPLSSFDLKTPTGEEIPIEERPAEEVTEGFGKRTAPVGMKVYNPAFDITPSSLITAIITEKGILYPDQNGRYENAMNAIMV